MLSGAPHHRNRLSESAFRRIRTCTLATELLNKGIRMKIFNIHLHRNITLCHAQMYDIRKGWFSEGTVRVDLLHARGELLNSAQVCERVAKLSGSIPLTRSYLLHPDLLR
jgi:hypothetical protein